MSNDNKTIHDFDFTFICNYFKALERQGPGSPEMTLKALEYIDNLGPQSKVADLGCGTGGQTMTLARALDCEITGLDLFPDFIDIFNRNASGAGFSHRLKGVVGSMDKPPFGEGELDLIWSEGAIYNIGFEEGLKLWHRYLKPGGYVAVTEATWFTDERPQEIFDFWNDSYPAITTIPENIARMQRAGYIPVAHFTLPGECWTQHFFKPQEKVRETFLKSHPGNDTVKDFVAGMVREEELYNKYSEFYGYVFYIGRKI